MISWIIILKDLCADTSIILLNHELENQPGKTITQTLLKKRRNELFQNLIYYMSVKKRTGKPKLQGLMKNFISVLEKYRLIRYIGFPRILYKNQQLIVYEKYYYLSRTLHILLSRKEKLDMRSNSVPVEHVTR